MINVTVKKSNSTVRKHNLCRDMIIKDECIMTTMHEQHLKTHKTVTKIMSKVRMAKCVIHNVIGFIGIYPQRTKLEPVSLVAYEEMTPAI